MLLFTASELEKVSRNAGAGPAAAGLIGGMGGGIAQAYATMGMPAFLVIRFSAHAGFQASRPV